MCAGVQVSGGRVHGEFPFFSMHVWSAEFVADVSHDGAFGCGCLTASL